jgi:hypothetical protein
MSDSDMASARRAKEELKATIGAEPWCAGVGVEREDGVGFIVRVSVRPGTSAEAKGAIPARLGGVMVKVIETD